jgi:hypothetical protein
LSDKKYLDLNNIPLDSSLGHLAIGDIAFEAWRELKKSKNSEEKNQQEPKREE